MNQKILTKNRLFPKLQLIPILHLQVMHDSNNNNNSTVNIYLFSAEYTVSQCTLHKNKFFSRTKKHDKKLH